MPTDNQNLNFNKTSCELYAQWGWKISNFNPVSEGERTYIRGWGDSIVGSKYKAWAPSPHTFVQYLRKHFKNIQTFEQFNTCVFTKKINSNPSMVSSLITGEDRNKWILKCGWPVSRAYSSSFSPVGYLVLTKDWPAPQLWCLGLLTSCYIHMPTHMLTFIYIMHLYVHTSCTYTHTYITSLYYYFVICFKRSIDDAWWYALFNPFNIWETEEGRSLRVWFLACLHNEFQVSHGYILRPCLTQPPPK